ncbi:MAG: class I SAM-dependent methyltransferase [Bacteroidales bacterium]|nr:class I SAM-dependent methyltransferase [Bacteroidales bacterium]MCF6342192.1 class I SAM-dependent methyltransferase [Bacteroidales bacterium]
MSRNYKGIPINTTLNTHERVFNTITKDVNAKIADIPSGQGAFIKRLKDNGYKNITAIDIENIMEIDHEDFVIGDMTKKLPFPDDHLNCIICIDGIEHISKQFDFVEEVNRILVNDGEFIISTPNISSIRSRFKWLMTGHHHKCNSPLDENNPTPLHHIGMISFPEIRYLLHTKGFRVIKVSTNRIKPISWLYAVFVPFIYLSTLFVYWRTAKKDGTQQINREVFKSMFTKSILFGETIIVKAIKLSG